MREFTTNSNKNIQFFILFALCKNYKVTHLLKGFPRYRWIRKTNNYQSAHKMAANANVSAQCISFKSPLWTVGVTDKQKPVFSCCYNIRELKQARTATAVNKQLNFTVKNKPHTTNYIYCIFEAYFMIKNVWKNCIDCFEVILE